MNTKGARTISVSQGVQIPKIALRQRKSNSRPRIPHLSVNEYFPPIPNIHAILCTGEKMYLCQYESNLELRNLASSLTDLT